MAKLNQEVKINPLNSPSLKNWGEPPEKEELKISKKNIYVECGWGRLIFAHTFDQNTNVTSLIRGEENGKRDIAFYIRDPHVALAQSPHELFLDPSHTYRFWLKENQNNTPVYKGFSIRVANPDIDIPAINKIYQAHGMVPIDRKFLKNNYDQKVITYFVAVDSETGDVIGVVMGADHVLIFDDPENGSSLWALAVDPQARVPGVGQALVQHLIEFYQERGRIFMDLSVLHSNTQANRLYDKLGFERVPVFCVKRKNAINEKLYSGPEPMENLNPYATIIVKEARKRGIAVKVIDDVNNYFSLTYGGRSIVCRESLTELTTAIAMSRCADKAVTHSLAKSIGAKVPAQRVVNGTGEDLLFLEHYNQLAVKPADNEQGKGISLMVGTESELEQAIRLAKKYSDKVILEEFVTGTDLRIIIIDFKMVAAAIRRPPEIIGDGSHTILELIQKQSRRREAATHGESKIPVDRETEKCVGSQGYDLENILPAEKKLLVRRTANLHTGGTIHDVTEKLHPKLAEAAIDIAKAIDIPVVGIDFMIQSPEEPDYYFIEANERPGLANHEPQPTAERFIDLLFPNTIPVEGVAKS
ncbi:GNAT-family acetyltransferase TIGR03103 [Chloroherpeton thalassium ATCC 35110]|uniref:GNAT-family acetyltransferase TIGR03103 n=1 Tax=Chloroherpeton thalassium (strain ATCC 35110 / GB-78) TaxID=517418 RepID=B3QY66_CHLT3|nr:N-acetylglutaminylglutamine synthetase [Chloroherpeton thalassium]ACF15032.1 GNAT-family acetyltransferase TIGR03103 [Chloroherpeton thalassium ATCC 35110]